MSFFPNKDYSIGQVNSHTFTVHFCGQMLFHLHRFYDDDDDDDDDDNSLESPLKIQVLNQNNHL